MRVPAGTHEVAQALVPWDALAGLAVGILALAIAIAWAWRGRQAEPGHGTRPDRRRTGERR